MDFDMYVWMDIMYERWEVTIVMKRNLSLNKIHNFDFWTKLSNLPSLTNLLFSCLYDACYIPDREHRYTNWK